MEKPKSLWNSFIVSHSITVNLFWWNKNVEHKNFVETAVFVFDNTLSVGSDTTVKKLFFYLTNEGAREA